MKKFKYLLLIMVATFMSVTYVNAETLTMFPKFYIDNYLELYDNYEENIDILYTDLLEYYNNFYKTDYPYFTVELRFIDSGNEIYMAFNIYNFMPSFTYNNGSFSSIIDYSTNALVICSSYIINSTTYVSPAVYNLGNNFIHYMFNDGESDEYYPVYLYSSNFDVIYNSSTTLILNNYGLNSNETIILNNGDILPPFYNYINTNKYTEVNLDNYEYVVLSLKDYSKTEAFNVGLKVKGMIGITPVYEFGTVEKDVNSGDRCNINYLDYTDYRLYILKNDLINNAIYYVKGCQDGSSFKFDSSIFDITYVTADNVDDPVITFGGVEYHTIPFKELSWSANSNEENNVIPGESEQFDPVSGVISYISNFWNSLTTLMSLVTKFFNTLPIEIRAISITMFTTAITLGVIKFLKS